MAEEKKRTSSGSDFFSQNFTNSNTRNGNKKMNALSLQPTGPSSGGGFGGANLFQAAQATKQSKEAPDATTQKKQ